MRLFVGIPLADAVVRELAAIVSRLRPSAGNLRWTASESWHITLQFLGAATPEQYECLAARLAEVRAAPVPVQLGELGCFDRAGVFFVEAGLTRELVALEQRVVAATSKCGFVAETRPFHPHITLARAKGTGPRGGTAQSAGKIRGHPAFTRFIGARVPAVRKPLGAGRRAIRGSGAVRAGRRQ